jgi:glycosyltransferase involved in cell wall biosynthesis
MRVLHVIPAVAPRYGGPSQAVLGMCRALLEQDVETLIATTDADGAGRLPAALGEPTTYRGVPAVFFPRQWSEAFKYSRPLERWLRAHVADFDVVHVHAVFSHACLAAARSCRRQGVPYVVTAHGSLERWSLRQKALRKRLLWHLGVGQMLRGAAAIHYTSAEERQQSERPLGLCHGVVIPLGVDREPLAVAGAPESFRRSHPSLAEHPYVLVLSRLHPKKGVELLLGAFLDASRRDEFRDWRLVIAGDGEREYVKALKRHALDHCGDERIVFTGWLGAEDKAGALRGAALLALPSYQENFGVSVVEAMACGVPVLVSTQVDLAQEIAAAGAGWVADLSRPAVTEALVEALRAGEERSRRGAAGRALARDRFTWPPAAARLAGLYRSIASRPCGPRC